MSLRLRPLALVVALLAALAVPSLALGQVGGGGGQLGAPEVPDAPPPATDPNDDGWAAWQTLAVTGAGVLLLIGIGFAIVGDARRAAPVSEEEMRHQEALSLGDPQGERMHNKGGKARARKKQKTARQSRKRNRQRTR